MSEVLYRKYRPQTFSQVLGQDIVKTILQNALRKDAVSHAYLFSGPRGVGKTTLARILAKAVNCQSLKDGEPDTTCKNCTAVQEGRFLDLLEIDAASYTGVDNIRDIIDHVRFAPSLGKYKVFVIDEVHMLSKAAFNALLKTLEEPPAHAIFILATTEIHKVPATIISRSQYFDFRRVSLREILELLEKVLVGEGREVPREALLLMAQAAEGSFRDALSILDQALALGDKHLSVPEIEEVLGIVRVSANQKFLDYLIRGETRAAVKFVKDLAFAGKDLVQFTRSFLEYLRLVLFVKMGVEEAEDLGLAAEEHEALNRQSEFLAGRRLLEIIKSVLEAHREIKHSPVAELPLLSAILALESEAGLKPEETAAMSSPPLAAVSIKAAGQGIALGTIVDRWAEVLSRVKEYNHSLLSTLRLGRLVRLEGAELVMAFPYNFHKQTLEARKNRIVVEQVLEDIFQRQFRVKVFLERELAGESGEQAATTDLMSEALKVLGE